MGNTALDPILVISLAAAATYASRGFGAFLSGRIKADDKIIEWITCVTYALMAGLVVRMIVLPIGALIAVPLTVRLFSTSIGLLVFFLFRKNIGLGVATGSLTLCFLMWDSRILQVF
ncbi:MAG: AzlD domain-containing protein [Magnetovibrio sp.]|nr:AzlD domain-containing protein [Magnetovibrio sp.]